MVTTNPHTRVEIENSNRNPIKKYIYIFTTHDNSYIMQRNNIRKNRGILYQNDKIKGMLFQNDKNKGILHKKNKNKGILLQKNKNKGILYHNEPQTALNLYYKVGFNI